MLIRADNDASNAPNVNYTNIFEAFEGAQNESNALGGLLFEIAAGRYAEDSRDGKQILYTTHRGRTVLLYKAPSFVLRSLPFRTPSERAASALFSSHYNAFHVKRVDQKALAGEYQPGIELYGILVHLNRQIWSPKQWTGSDQKIPRLLEFSGRATTDLYEKKLRLLEDLAKTPKSVAKIQEFQELFDDFTAEYNFGDINTLKPLEVENLLEVKLP